MKLALIACRVLQRDLSFALALSPHICEVFWLEQGLHNTPSLLRDSLLSTIIQVEQRQEMLPEHKKYDAIVLGYGLCSNGIIGAGSDILPVIAPRCDDCIALFLGSQARYIQLFHQHHGVYWYNPGWIEQGEVPNEALYRRKHAEYSELYGEDNADFLLESEVGWVSNYKTCGYITSPFYPSGALQEHARAAARFLGWEYLEFDGKMDYINKLVSGEWDDDEFLYCPKGFRISESFDYTKIKAARD